MVAVPDRRWVSGTVDRLVAIVAVQLLVNNYYQFFSMI
jgi:hypothetical protein